jgi:hypothetical protein
MWAWRRRARELFGSRRAVGVLNAGYTGPMIVAARHKGSGASPGAVILFGRGMSVEEGMRKVRVRHELLPSEAEELAAQLKAMATAARRTE